MNDIIFLIFDMHHYPAQKYQKGIFLSCHLVWCTILIGQSFLDDGTNIFLNILATFYQERTLTSEESGGCQTWPAYVWVKGSFLRFLPDRSHLQ